MTDGGNPPGSGKPWGGRFTAGADPAAEAFTSSLAFDRRLWLHDIRGSAAWARGLERAGLIDAAEGAGFWKLVSRVIVENEASRALLRSLGFREVGTYRRHGKLDGEWRDCVIVELLLGEAAL